MLSSDTRNEDRPLHVVRSIPPIDQLTTPADKLEVITTHTTNSAGQVSGRFSADPANNFLLMHGDFGELSEVFHLDALAGSVVRLQ